MKIFLLTTMFCFSCATCAAQSESIHKLSSRLSVTPTAGLVFSTFVGSGAENSSTRVGLTTGLEMTFQTDNLFGYSTGVSYCQLGALEERTTYGLISRLDYINVPLLLNLRLSKRTYAPILKTGVRLGFLVGAKFSDDMGSIQPDNGLSANDLFKTFDCSIPISLSWNFNRFVIGADYVFGLLDIVNKPATIYGVPYHNDSVHLISLETHVGYRL